MTSLKTAGIYIQNACLQHRYIRSKDLSNIVERPERLRAVNIGLAAAIARLEALVTTQSTNIAVQSSLVKDEANPDDLADELNKLRLTQNTLQSPVRSPVSITTSDATVDLVDHPAIKFIHGDLGRDVYLENLMTWANESVDKIKKGESEIPQGYAQGDLYLCPGSINAIQGAIGTICEAVDRVISSTRMSENPGPEALHRAFIAVRPPGHHCGENTPSGFCFVNNIVIGAAHAHLKHGIKRVVIFDIDLHHGNGTQSIVWQINEETYRQTLESEEGSPGAKTGLEIFYGSVHDILSYPCEGGKLEMVQAASVSIHNAHGQYIENVHLETYTDEEHFWNVLYRQKYSKLLLKARKFLDHTGGPGDDVMILISCGMDACEHEYESMSRHNRKVPASFYYQFARDTCAISDEYAKGRVISVLEGGYSDRALTSGAMSHLTGLVDVPPSSVIDKEWWNIDNLKKLESATKKRRGGRPSLPAQGSVEPWIQRAVSIFSILDTAASQAAATAPRVRVPAPPSSMTLRDKTKAKGKSSSPPSSRSKPASSSGKSNSTSVGQTKTAASEGPSSVDSSPLSSPDHTDNEVAEKKLPKVILKLGKPY